MMRSAGLVLSLAQLIVASCLAPPETDPDEVAPTLTAPHPAGRENLLLEDSRTFHIPVVTLSLHEGSDEGRLVFNAAPADGASQAERLSGVFRVANPKQPFGTPSFDLSVDVSKRNPPHRVHFASADDRHVSVDGSVSFEIEFEPDFRTGTIDGELDVVLEDSSTLVGSFEKVPFSVECYRFPPTEDDWVAENGGTIHMIDRLHASEFCAQHDFFAAP